MTPEAADTIRRAADVVQWFNLAVSVAVLAALVYVLTRWPRGWRMAVLPASYMVASTAFYVAVLFHAIHAPWISLFSATLRLYSYILAIVIGSMVVLGAVGAEDEDDWEPEE